MMQIKEEMLKSEMQFSFMPFSVMIRQTMLSVRIFNNNWDIKTQNQQETIEDAIALLIGSLHVERFWS